MGFIVKKLSLCFVLVCFVLPTMQAGGIVYKNREQSWELVDVQSDDDYTIISCDITITSIKPGCMDAHTYDKKNSSIYISGDFGRKDIIKSQFEGDYVPWEIYPGHYEWNYFREFQKGKVVHATFYFSRVPAGVTTIDWHFDGGVGDWRSPCHEYRTPIFDVRNIELTGNVNPTPQTGWSESALKAHWQTNNPATVEGIYVFKSTSNQKFWGNARHRLAVKKDGDSYQIIYLQGSNEEVWTEGELKGVFSPTTTKGVYHVDLWYLDNKVLSNSDFYLEYHERNMTLHDSESTVETLFMKLYPAHDVDE